ncbi:unnamed protein product [Oikopleura dioica]|uniref:Uncharacterized protein n=1 Tax=Oikopleura dioica TaxID=34765 RepID=E4YY95_OIKDI|nr:unnamed protein product [Oikopleura dioica]
MKVEIASIWKFCVACPSLAFFACLILSLWTDWQRSVFTECIKDGKKHHPYNLLPSISMMISADGVHLARCNSSSFFSSFISRTLFPSKASSTDRKQTTR